MSPKYAALLDLPEEDDLPPLPVSWLGLTQDAQKKIINVTKVVPVVLKGHAIIVTNYRLIAKKLKKCLSNSFLQTNRFQTFFRDS
jgi:hypothetical protein